MEINDYTMEIPKYSPARPSFEQSNDDSIIYVHYNDIYTIVQLKDI